MSAAAVDNMGLVLLERPGDLVAAASIGPDIRVRTFAEILQAGPHDVEELAIYYAVAILPATASPGVIDQARAATTRLRVAGATTHLGQWEGWTGGPFLPPANMTSGALLAWACALPSPIPPRSGDNRSSRGAETAVDYVAMSDSDLGLSKAGTVRARPIQWAWQYRAARGKMGLIAGEGGLGKSQVMLAIAATVSRGGAWMDGSGNAERGQVLVLSAEDTPEDTIVPRLLALGADMDQVNLLRARYTIRHPDRPPLINPVSLQDRDYWAEVFRRLPNLKLMLIDPLPSYLGRGVNDARNGEIRAVLEPFLDQFVEPIGFHLLCNTHLNKSVNVATPVHRITGSIAYANLPRNVHVVVRDPEDPDRRYLQQIKCNNAPDDLPAIAFRIEPREVPGGDGEAIETAVPVFEVEPVHIDVRALMSGAQPKGKPGPKATVGPDLARWLVRYLLARPGMAATNREVFAAAGAAGLIGELRERKDGRLRWSNGSAVYDAIKLVPNLDGDEAGVQVVEEQETDSRGYQIARWRLESADALQHAS